MSIALRSLAVNRTSPSSRGLNDAMASTICCTFFATSVEPAAVVKLSTWFLYRTIDHVRCQRNDVVVIGENIVGVRQRDPFIC